MIADALVAGAMHAQTSPQSLLVQANDETPEEAAEAIPVKKQKSKSTKKSKDMSKGSSKEVQDHDLEDVLDASAALERELLLKLNELLEMKFDIIRLVEVNTSNPLLLDWVKLNRDNAVSLQSSQSTTSELRGKSWGLMISEPVVRGVMSHTFSTASCLVRWVRGQGIVVDAMPQPDGGYMAKLGADAEETPIPECAAWLTKQVALEKSVESTLARALMTLYPSKASSVSC
jgi:hypothetical protein